MAKLLKKKKRLAGAGVPVRRITRFRPIVFSRHPSHGPLRTLLGLLPFRSLIRLGSTTDRDDTIAKGGDRVECNTITAVRNSADKLLMKRKFGEAGVKTAIWASGHVNIFGEDEGGPLQFPIVAKHRRGSRGEGNTLLMTRADYDRWAPGKTLENYIFEHFYDMKREYRLHVTKDGCFYTCRKMLKKDCPDDQRWRRHEDNCVWIVDTNPDFNRPVNWDAIVADCVKALAAVGLDIGAFDVKVQSARNNRGQQRPAPEWILLECNSAPSFGEGTLAKYLEEIPKVLRAKFLADAK